MQLKKNILSPIVNQFPPHPIPKSVSDSGEAELQAEQQPSTPGWCRATISVARGYHSLRRYQTLVPLFGMLLTVHHILYPEVASHL